MTRCAFSGGWASWRGSWLCPIPTSLQGPSFTGAVRKKCDFVNYPLLSSFISGYMCCFPSCSLLVLSSAGCWQLLRLASCRLVSYPQSLPPLVVRLAWDRVVDNLWTLGRRCSKKLPEGVCKKVSRRGVDDQTFCWRGIEGALLRRMGTKPEKCISLWNFSCASLNCSNGVKTVVAFLGIA